MDSIFQILKPFFCRFIPWLVICASFSLGFYSEAHADYPAQKFYYVAPNVEANYKPSALEACQNRIQRLQAATTGSAVYTYIAHTETSCTWHNSQFVAGNDSTESISVTYKCGTVYNPNQTTCPGTPPPDCSTKTGQTAVEDDFTDSDGDGQLTPITCHESCQAALSASSPGQPSCTFGSSGVGSCFPTIHGKYIYTGAVCTGSEQVPAPAPPPQPNCPQCECFEKGGSYGTVNGVPTCVPAGTPGSPPVEYKQPPKVETTTPPATPENPNPQPVTTITNTTTTIIAPTSPGGEPQVKETKTNSDGSTSTVSMGKDQYCQQNPNAKLCGEGSDDMFGGSCNAGFSCDGDVIQCAIAKEQHKRNCELFEKTTPQSDLGNQLIAGTDIGETNNPAKLENREVISLPETLDSSDGGVVGSLQNVSVPFGGQSITLPFSSLNGALDICGLIILGIGYFSAYRIIGGVK